VVAVLSFISFVNVGMVVGFMPVTGIPLPLMSMAGLRSVHIYALGLVMNVRMRRFVKLNNDNKIVVPALERKNLRDSKV